jgi:hypothetical protein
MLIIDHSIKTVHIAVQTICIKNQAFSHAGLIYVPAQVFSKVNEVAETHYAEFFEAGKGFCGLCLSTEMGPGELVGVFEKRFGVDTSLIIGGMLAEFTINESDLTSFWDELINRPRQFSKSKEKRNSVGRRPRGVRLEMSTK